MGAGGATISSSRASLRWTPRSVDADASEIAKPDGVQTTRAHGDVAAASGGNVSQGVPGSPRRTTMPMRRAADMLSTNASLSPASDTARRGRRRCSTTAEALPRLPACAAENAAATSRLSLSSVAAARLTKAARHRSASAGSSSGTVGSASRSRQAAKVYREQSITSGGSLLLLLLLLESAPGTARNCCGCCCR